MSVVPRVAIDGVERSVEAALTLRMALSGVSGRRKRDPLERQRRRRLPLVLMEGAGRGERLDEDGAHL